MAEPGSPQAPTIPASADPLIDTTDTRPPARSRPETVSRFLIITIDDSTQSTPLNPFQLHRAVCRLGKASRVTLREDGKVEVEMETTEGAQKLLSSDTLFYDSKRGTGTVSIQVSAHPTKGFAMGVITAPDLKGVEEDEILEEMRDQGIQRVRRLQRREGDVMVPSDSIVLSFSGEKLPGRVRVAWRSARVRPFVPYPIRCYRCQAYGHIASRCRGQERCGRCSSLGHNSASCEASPRCTCGGDHEVWSGNCPMLQAEKKRVRERMGGKRTAAPQSATPSAPPLPTSTIERPAEAAETLAPYRNALMRGRHPPQETPTPHPPVTSESRVRDCMNLTVRQFLTLLSDSRRTTQRSEAANTATNDVGVQCSISDMVHRPVQTDPADDLPVPSRRDAAVQCALEVPTAASAHLPQNRCPSAEESVMAAQRREERERQARDVKRVCLAQRTTESKRPPDPRTSGLGSGSEAGRSSGTGTQAASPTPPVAAPSRPRPHLLRPSSPMAPPPPPPQSAASEGAAQPMTPASAPGRMGPPSAPERPIKRNLPAEFSPTGDGSPRTRQSSASGGRSTSADGRVRPAKPRITFRDVTSRSTASSDWEELF